MRKALPVNPDLNYLKLEAKTLKRSVDQKNYSVSYRIIEHLATYQPGGTLSLGDAQFVTAREYGFPSWSKLKQAILLSKKEPQGTSDSSLTLSRINITCGDRLSTVLKDCSIPGQRLPWKDLLCIGPLPKTEGSHSFFLRRARFITQWTQLKGLPDVDKMAKQEHKLLRDTLSSKTIVIWVWPHLSNQLLLLFLVDWYQRNNYEGKLHWIDAGQEPNRLDEDYIKTLIKTEAEVTPLQIDYAGELWKALSDKTPDKLISILNKKIELFPRINDALWRYLEELPNINTGLSLQQYLVLEAIQNGHNSPREIYNYVHQNEIYFIAGDWHLWHVIAQMTNIKSPLIQTKDGAIFFYPPLTMSDNFEQQDLSITDIGQQYFNNEESFQKMEGVNRFWGGLDTNHCQSWRYNPETRTTTFIE
jgi:hypothetical protein